MPMNSAFLVVKQHQANLHINVYPLNHIQTHIIG